MIAYWTNEKWLVDKDSKRFIENQKMVDVDFIEVLKKSDVEKEIEELFVNDTYYNGTRVKQIIKTKLLG